MDQKCTETHQRTRLEIIIKTQRMGLRKQASRVVLSVSINQTKQLKMMRRALSTIQLNQERTQRRKDIRYSWIDHISLHKHIEHRPIDQINSAATFRIRTGKRRFIRTTRISTNWRNSQRLSRLNMKRHLSQGRNWRLSRFNHQCSSMPNRLTPMNFLRIKTTCKSSGSREAIIKVACN